VQSTSGRARRASVSWPLGKKKKEEKRKGGRGREGKGGKEEDVAQVLLRNQYASPALSSVPIPLLLLFSSSRKSGKRKKKEKK